MALLCAWLGPAVAHACKCGPPVVSFISAPYFTAPDSLVAGDEEVWLDCAGVECVWKSRHTIRNDGADDVRTKLIVVSSGASNLKVLIDGSPLPLGTPRETTANPQEPDPEIESTTAPLTAVDYGRAEFEARSAWLSIPPDTEVNIELSAVMRPERWECDCGFWGIRARHLLVTSVATKRHVAFARLQELPSAPDTKWRARVNAPRGEGLTVHAVDAPDRGTRRARDYEVELDRSVARAIDFELDQEWANSRLTPRARAGGPFVGVGGGFGDGRGLRLRGGYEFAFPQFVAWGLAVESDAKRHVEVIPTVELVPPWGTVLSLFPMPGLGFGAPVQVWPQPRAGFRTQLSVGWYFVTIVGSLDLYPAANGDARMLRGGLLLQLSL